MNVTSNINVTVSIPVLLGGYTGQRDQWEQNEIPYAVSLSEDGEITLRGSGAFQRKIVFNEADLKDALDFIRDRKR